MKSIAIGVVSAIVALGLFFSGFVMGANVAEGNDNGYVRYLTETTKHTESSQMQCIHWLENWRSAGQPTGVDGPSFGMYADLCGKPAASK